MSIHQRCPVPPLNAHVDRLWYYHDFYPDHDREFVLPDGSFNLIINLEERPRRLFDRSDFNRYRLFRRGWISGAQEEYLVIDALQGSTMIGAHFKPGGAAAFLGLPADELSGQVVELDAIWGDGIWEWRDWLVATAAPEAKLALLERLLLERLANDKRRKPNSARIHWTLDRFMREPQIQNIHSVTSELAISHKHFISEFRQQVGLTPKLFCRVRRFQQVLAQIHSCKQVVWTDVAYSCGYFDQAHFVNDFIAFAGVNPTAYLCQQIEGDPNFIRAAVER